MKLLGDDAVYPNSYVSESDNVMHLTRIVEYNFYSSRHGGDADNHQTCSREIMEHHNEIPNTTDGGDVGDEFT